MMSAICPARAGVALAAVLLFCIATTAVHASIVPDVSVKQFIHGSTNQTYTEALIIVNNRDSKGVWQLLSLDVMGAYALTRFPQSFGVGGVGCHIVPTNPNQPSDKWHATYSFRTATNDVVYFEVDYVNGRSAPVHTTTRNNFKNTTVTFSDYSASLGKGFLFSFDYVPN